MKAVKKKYYTSKEAEDSGSEEELSVSSKDCRLDLEFLSVSEIETYLKTLDEFKDCPEDLISEMAVEVHK